MNESVREFFCTLCFKAWREPFKPDMDCMPCPACGGKWQTTYAMDKSAMLYFSVNYDTDHGEGAFDERFKANNPDFKKA